MKPNHPIQPLIKDADGTTRFKHNAIVRHLLEVGRRHGCDINMIGTMNFSDDDRRQFAQLIGYTLGGYGDLGYVNEAAFARAASGGDQNPLEETPKLTTKLALEIIHWKPDTRPFGAFDADVIKYFWTKSGRKWPKTLTVSNSKLVEMHDKLRDEALTLLASRLDNAAFR
jgi:hypothetical protein